MSHVWGHDGTLSVWFEHGNWEVIGNPKFVVFFVCLCPRSPVDVFSHLDGLTELAGSIPLKADVEIRDGKDEDDGFKNWRFHVSI